MYYQFDRCGRYLTLTQEDCRAITEWINEYFVGGSAPFPLSGEIPAADYRFVVDYNTEAEAIRDSIKAEMMERDTEEMTAGKYIVRWTSVLSNRFDTTAFKKAHGELYKEYTKQSASRRFSISA